MKIVFRVLNRFCSYVFLLFSFIIFCPSQGYCFNEMNSIKANKDTLSIETSISFGGSRRTGTFSQRILTIGLVTEVKLQKWELSNKANYIFSNTNGLVVADDWIIISSLHYELSQNSKIKPAIFHEFRKNIQYRINSSHKFFLGWQIHPFDKKHNYSMYAGLGYEHTRYHSSIFKNSNKINESRSFEIAIFHIKNNHDFFDKKFLIKYDIFYVQSFRESQDFTFGIVADINFPLNKRILVGIKYDFRLRNVHLIDTSRLNDLLSFNCTVGLSK